MKIRPLLSKVKVEFKFKKCSQTDVRADGQTDITKIKTDTLIELYYNIRMKKKSLLILIIEHKIINKRAMMALDRSPEAVSYKLNQAP